MGETSWYPSVLLSSGIIVAAWGYFLYIGVIDPNGGINILWPLSGYPIRYWRQSRCASPPGSWSVGKLKFAWITGLPLPGW